MPVEIVGLLSSAIGIVIGALVNYWLTRRKYSAEVEKLKAETEKIKAEADKTRAEIQKGTNATAVKSLVTLGQEDPQVRINLRERLLGARTVSMLGYSLNTILRDMREPIADAVSNGTVVRMLVVDMTGETGRLVLEHSFKPHLLMPDMVTALERFRDIRSFIRAKPKVNGRLEIKLTSWIPSCHLILIDAEQDDGLVKVSLNHLSFRQPLTDRLNMVFERRNHPKECDYFIRQFDILWNTDSYEWDGSIPQMIGTNVVNPEQKSA